MSGDFTISATSRADSGKGASRRLRRLENKIPGIVYGANKPAQQIAIEFKVLVKALENEAFYSHVLTLDVDGSAEQVGRASDGASRITFPSVPSSEMALIRAHKFRFVFSSIFSQVGPFRRVGISLFFLLVFGSRVFTFH